MFKSSFDSSRLVKFIMFSFRETLKGDVLLTGEKYKKPPFLKIQLQIWVSSAYTEVIIKETHP